jgi:hypothetical protein
VFVILIEDVQKGNVKVEKRKKLHLKSGETCYFQDLDVKKRKKLHLKSGETCYFQDLDVENGRRKITSKIWGNLLFSRSACRKLKKITSTAAIILDVKNKIKSKRISQLQNCYILGAREKRELRGRRVDPLAGPDGVLDPMTRGKARPFPAARNGYEGREVCSAWWRWASSRRRAMETGPAGSGTFASARHGDGPSSFVWWRRPSRLPLSSSPPYPEKRRGFGRD